MFKLMNKFKIIEIFGYVIGISLTVLLYIAAFF